MIGNLFKNMDFLSPNVELFLDGSNKIRTKLGGILCMKLMIVSIIGFFFFFSKVIDYSDYIVSSSKIYEKFHNHTLNTSQTILGFRLISQFGTELSDNTYTAYAKFLRYSFIKDSQGKDKQIASSNDLNISKCINNNYTSSEDFSSIDLSSFYCIDPGQLINFINPFGQHYEFSSLNIYFTYCTHRNDCKNETILDKELEAYYVNVIRTNYYIDNTNYSTPLIPFITNFVELSGSAFFKRAYNYLKTINYISDVGLILEERRNITQVVDEKIEINMDFRKQYINKGKLLFQYTMAFNKDGFKEIYIRNYKRIQNVLAEVGGFLSFLKIVVSIALIFYNDIVFIHIIFKDFNFHYNQGE